MATEKFFYLDKAGLAQYDALIKQYVDDADALSIKYITYDTATTPTTLSFWKVDPTESGATLFAVCLILTFCCFFRCFAYITTFCRLAQIA